MQTQDYPREGQALALREAPVVRARLSANSLERKQDFQDSQDFQDESIGASEGFLVRTQDYPREGQALALREAPVVRARLSANSQGEGICASEGFLMRTQDYPREGQALALRGGAEKLTTRFFSSFLYSPVPVGENEGMNYSLSCSRRRWRRMSSHCRKTCGSFPIRSLTGRAAHTTERQRITQRAIS